MEMKPLNAFPANLKRLRESREWSQAKLAHEVGVSQTTIGQYELGIIYPRVKTLARIADVFGITVMELIDEPRPKSSMSYAEVCLVANYRRLNDEGKAMLSKQAEMMVASGYYGA